MKILIILVLLALASPSVAAVGPGATTITCIDWDSDGYGIGPGCIGNDADDNDATVQTAEQGIAKYGSLALFINHLGYTPLRYWYLDPVNGNDTTCIVNDSTKPCKTFHKLWPGTGASLVQAGDIVLFHVGTYNESIVLNYPNAIGTSSNPIILMGYPGERAKIDNHAQWPMHFDYAQYLITDGLEFTDSIGSIAIGAGQLDGHGAMKNVIFRNNYLHHMGRGIHTGGDAVNDGLLIEKNYISETLAEHGLYIGNYAQGTPEAPTKASQDVTIRYNIINNNEYNNIQYSGQVTNLAIHDNILFNAKLSCISLLDGVNDSHIYNNLCFQPARSGIVFYDYDDSNPNILPSSQKNNIIENNTFWLGKYDQSGFDMSGQVQPVFLLNDDSTSGPHDFSGNVFRNNVAVSYSGPLIQFSKPAWYDTTIIDHNILYSQSGGSAVRYNGTNYTLAQAQAAYPANINNNISTDPLLAAVDINWWNATQNFDLKLQSGSPAINAASLTGLPTTDILGITRGSQADIGAYEYSAPPADNTPPSTTPNKQGRFTASQLVTLTANEAATTVYCRSTSADCTPATSYSSVIKVLVNIPYEKICYKSTDSASNVETTKCTEYRKQRRK